MFGKGKPRDFLKDLEVVLSKECITQNKPLACDFKIRKVKDTRRKFEPRKKIGKLHEYSVNRDLRSYINQYRASSQDNSVYSY